MGDTLKVTDPSTRLQVVANGPVEEGPEFVVDRVPDMSWRHFYEAERTFRSAPRPFARDDGYDQLQWVTHHAVLDAEGRPVTPIVSELAIANEGYVVTWSQVFWREGFFIHKGKPAFLSVGRDEAYATFGGFVRFVVSGAGQEVDRAGLDAHLSPSGEHLDAAQVAELTGLLRP